MESWPRRATAWPTGRGRVHPRPALRPAQLRRSLADRERALPPYQRVWLKAAGDLPDDPVIHACALTYASDMTLLDTALLPHGLHRLDNAFMASLDHAMWFHRPFRADEWLLYAQDTPSASGGRGFARGLVFTATASWP